MVAAALTTVLFSFEYVNSLVIVDVFRREQAHRYLWYRQPAYQEVMSGGVFAPRFWVCPGWVWGVWGQG